MIRKVHIGARTAIPILAAIGIFLAALTLSGSVEAQTTPSPADIKSPDPTTTPTRASQPARPTPTRQPTDSNSAEQTATSSQVSGQTIKRWLAPTIVGVVMAAGAAAIFLGVAQGKREQRRREGSAPPQDPLPDPSTDEVPTAPGVTSDENERDDSDELPEEADRGEPDPPT